MAHPPTRVAGVANNVVRVLLALCLLAATITAAARAPSPSEQSYPGVAAAELPAEARETMATIRRGGPFPYRRDGIVFHNRERRLPGRPAGYYREYTVPAPGASDRGPRRIVVGERGEFYYTEDHYRRFRRIRE